MKKITTVLTAMLLLTLSVLAAYADQEGNARWCNIDSHGCYLNEEDGSRSYMHFWTVESCRFFMGNDDPCKHVVQRYDKDPYRLPLEPAPEPVKPQPQPEKKQEAVLFSILDWYVETFPQGIYIFNGVLLASDDIIGKEFTMSPNGSEILIPVYAPGKNYDSEQIGYMISDFQPLSADLTSNNEVFTGSSSLIPYVSDEDGYSEMNNYLFGLIEDQFEFQGFIPAGALNFSQAVTAAMDEGDNNGTRLTAIQLQPIAVQKDEEGNTTRLIFNSEMSVLPDEIQKGSFEDLVYDNRDSSELDGNEYDRQGNVYNNPSVSSPAELEFTSNKYEYNRPDIYMNGSSTNYFNTEIGSDGNGIFSFYGTINGTGIDRIIFGNSEIRLSNGDGSGFKGSIGIAEGAKFEVRVSDDGTSGSGTYEGKFPGSNTNQLDNRGKITIERITVENNGTKFEQNELNGGLLEIFNNQSYEIINSTYDGNDRKTETSPKVIDTSGIENVTINNGYMRLINTGGEEGKLTFRNSTTELGSLVDISGTSEEIENVTVKVVAVASGDMTATNLKLQGGVLAVEGSVKADGSSVG